ncbi:MAG: hypothetical protein AAF692_04020 [Pseudomonadota bacterium]
MQIHPAIAALRGTRSAQRLPSVQRSNQEAAASLRKAREDWLSQPSASAIDLDMQRYAAGADLESCFTLANLLKDPVKANDFVEAITLPTLHTLRAFPLGETPFRYRVSRGFAMIQLMDYSGVTLSLAVYEPVPDGEAPTSALLSDCEVNELVLAGCAHGVTHRQISDSQLTSIPLSLREGDTITLNPRSEAREVLKVEDTLLVLRLTREPRRTAPTRLVDLATGQTSRTASGDKSASQAVMALSVLGALGDEGALDVMAQTALNREDDADVRWEAARQALALGPVRGLSILHQLADRPDDTLAAPARALRATLLERQPELRAHVEPETL